MCNVRSLRGGEGRTAAFFHLAASLSCVSLFASGALLFAGWHVNATAYTQNVSLTNLPLFPVLQKGQSLLLLLLLLSMLSSS